MVTHATLRAAIGIAVGLCLLLTSAAPGQGGPIKGFESDLVVIRGGVNGPVPLRGEGFDVHLIDVHDSGGNLVCAPDETRFFFPGYLITFHEPFGGQPTVTLAIHGRAERPHIIQIDDVAVPGGITHTGFAVFMKDAQTNTCASQPFDFIAIGPRARGRR